ncbi:hypothetical protein IJI31_06050 [bacterium]|nr:hypothetical protein [bacterium]
MIHACYEGLNSYAACGVQKQSVAKATPIGTVVQTPSSVSNPSFKGVFSAWRLRTTLDSREDRKQYLKLLCKLDREGRNMLEYLLKTGILMSKDSQNNTTLSNLTKIVTTERAEGLSAKGILKDTVKTLANPYNVSQILGDIPSRYAKQVSSTVLADSRQKEATKKPDEHVAILVPSTTSERQTIDTINDIHSGCCPAASMEFDLASENPAEFARFAEGLSSKNMAVTKEIDLSSICDNTIDTIWLMNEFKIPYQAKDFNKATVTLAPDKNAIIRARIQTTDQNDDERTPLDVLMQSTFMNVASQQTYDTLTDTRGGKFDEDDDGLIEMEKTFLESIVNNRNTTSVIYQDIQMEEVTDASGNKSYKQKLAGYTKSTQETKDQIIETLKSGKNVIVGYIFTDNNNYVLGGHEVTISGIRINDKGQEEFIYNDTDSHEYSGKTRDRKPTYVLVDEFLPKIHHAGIPTEIATKTEQPQTDRLETSVNEFQSMLKGNQA